MGLQPSLVIKWVAQNTKTKATCSKNAQQTQNPITNPFRNYILQLFEYGIKHLGRRFTLEKVYLLGGRGQFCNPKLTDNGAYDATMKHSNESPRVTTMGCSIKYRVLS